MVCGNHDHYGNASAEVAYTSHSKRWHMPNYYYTQTFTIPGSEVTVQLVMIDTIILAGLIDFHQVGAQPMGPFSVSWAEDEWMWIEQTLQSSTADWLIVGGHYPVWSVAEHGPTQILVDRLRPLLMKYKVSAYICGHDHNLQYIQEANSSVSYFVTGGGHLSDPSLAHENDIPKGSLKFHYGPIDLLDRLGGFTTVSIGTEMTVTFFDNMGKQLYTVSRPKLR